MGALLRHGGRESQPRRRPLHARAGCVCLVPRASSHTLKLVAKNGLYARPHKGTGTGYPCTRIVPVPVVGPVTVCWTLRMGSQALKNYAVRFPVIGDSFFVSGNLGGSGRLKLVRLARRGVSAVSAPAAKSSCAVHSCLSSSRSTQARAFRYLCQQIFVLVSHA